jgi:hypothetical protein
VLKIEEGASLSAYFMRIQRVVGLFGLLAVVGTGWSQSSDAPKLTGIFYWKNNAQVLLECRSDKGSIGRPILSEGEAVGGVEVMRIDEKEGVAEVHTRRDNKKVTIDLGLPPEEQLPQRTFHFRSADLEQIFEVYQAVSARTVIRPGNLVFSKIDLKSGANLTPDDAVAILNKKFADAGIKMKRIGAKFVLALAPADELRIQSLTPPPVVDPADKVFAAGFMKFSAADPTQVLAVYCDLTGQPPINRDPRRGSKITLRSQTPLTRREAAWLLETALLLNGVPAPPKIDLN